jgi:hypothetical protein
MAIISLIWGDLALSKSWCNICHLDTTTTTLVLLTHILSHLDRANVGWGPSARSDGSGHSPTVPGCGDDEPRISRLAQGSRARPREGNRQADMYGVLKPASAKGRPSAERRLSESRNSHVYCVRGPKSSTHTQSITECPFNL